MKRNVSALSALVALFACCAMSIAKTKSGPITLAEVPYGEPGPVKIELGQTVKLVAEPAIENFFHSKIISARAKVQNTGSKPMWYAFNIAFFDKDGHLVGCASQAEIGSQGLAPGDAPQLGSCLINLPPDALGKVTRYEATFYESDKQF